MPILIVAMTRARRHLVRYSAVFLWCVLTSMQCVVGDSSTVRHGGRYLKDWLAWLDANADVRYGGLE